MKKAAFKRKVYVRLKSRYDRYGLGYHRAEALWRFDEQSESRFSHRSDVVQARSWRKFLRETDPTVLYQSPFIPRPHYDPEYWLPGKRS